MEGFAEQLQQMLIQLGDRVSNLEHTVNDVLIQSLKEAHEQYEHDELINCIKGHEGLGPLGERLKPLYGDDYDVVNEMAAAIGEHSGEEGFDRDSYIEQQIAEVNAKLDSMLGHTHPVDTTGDGVPDAETEPAEEDPEIPSDEQLAAELKSAQ